MKDVDVSAAVHAWLETTYPQQTWMPRQTVRVPIDVTMDYLHHAVVTAYKTFFELGDLHESVMLQHQRAPIRSVITSSAKAKIKRLAAAFEQPYLGLDALPVQLETYITSCWAKCVEEPTKYTFPCISIVQSAGFGKSRLLRELAHRTKDKSHRFMKVLCMNLRDGAADGFPSNTPRLQHHFFPSNATDDVNGNDLVPKLATDLLGLFEYAMAQWDDVGDKWFPLFMKAETEVSVASELESYLQTKETNTVDVHALDHKSRRVLVLAIDEASTLLKISAKDELGWFRRLRRALEEVNRQIRGKYGAFAGIFAVLVDTNSKISNFTPPSCKDNSSRHPGTNESVLFPPFILTQTMDIFFDATMRKAQQDDATKTCVAFYQSVVRADQSASRQSLASMGRPLWQQYRTGEPGKQPKLDWDSLIQLSADKLLGGDTAKNPANLNADTLNGVASLLCRVGLRPHSWSPLASRAVADFMAVLIHMSYAHNQFITTYSSEPILAFGAARVWHQSKDALETKIVPQLAKLCFQEVVETGGIGELVARFVLLLAMDTTTRLYDTTNKNTCCYEGDFYSVSDFSTCYPDTVLAPWKDWCVGFSHFVQLSEEPSEECLWALLARRAACLLPRNTKGVDLLIPIFQRNTSPTSVEETEESSTKADQTVSMILIQVKNRADGDVSSFINSSVVATRPWLVFKGSTFQNKKPHEVIRIYMSLRGFRTMERFFMKDPGVRRSERGANVTVPEPVTLCMRGLQAWEASTKTKNKTGTVLTQRVADELNQILGPWDKVRKLVTADLAARDSRFGRSEEEAIATTEYVLVESVVANKWQRVRGVPSGTGDGDSDGDGESRGAKAHQTKGPPATTVKAKPAAPAPKQATTVVVQDTQGSKRRRGTNAHQTKGPPATTVKAKPAAPAPKQATSKRRRGAKGSLEDDDDTTATPPSKRQMSSAKAPTKK